MRPVETPELRCRFGCEGPVGIYHVPKGCLCWSDPVQALCAQHFITAESDGPINLLLDLSESALRLRYALVAGALMVAGAGGPFIYYGNPWACVICMSLSLLMMSIAAIITPDFRDN